MQIIGVCGKKRHGKDSVGRILKSQYGFKQTAFADAVKRVAMDVYGLSWDQCYGEEQEKEDLIPYWDMSPRQIMQLIGTEVGRNIHKDTWVRHTLNNISAAAAGQHYLRRDDVNREFFRSKQLCSKWVITDVRFPNEAEAIWSQGGQIWKVQRPGSSSEDAHASETSVDLITPDITIQNDGSLEDLSRKVFQNMGLR